MKKNQDYENEINLKDVFFAVLYRWRSILAAALIGAVLLGVYQYVGLENVHRQGARTEEERQYEINLQKYHTSMETLQKDIETYTELIEARKEYRDNSPYLKLDPRAVWISERRYYVEVDPSVLEALPEGSAIDPANYVLAVYRSAMRGNVDDAALEETFGTSNISYVDEMAWVSVNMDENTVTAAARAATGEDAEKQLAFAVARIEELRDGKAQEINPHKLVLLNENTALRVDNGINTTKNQIKEELENYQTVLETAVADLNALELKEEPKAPGNHIKKMAAIGFLLGAFLMAGYAVVRSLLSGRLTDSDALTSQYDIPLYGDFYRSRARKPGKAPDKWIERWERGKTTQESEDVYSHIAALIQEKAAEGTVMLVSTLEAKELDDLASTLSAKLNGRIISCRADFLHNSGAVADASKADAVILVEEKHVSYLKNIDRMADLLIIGRANVIGAIVL